MQNELINSIVDIIIKTFLKDADDKVKDKIKNMVFLALNFIQAIQKNDFNLILGCFYEFLKQLPVKSGFDWTYSPECNIIQLSFEIIIKTLKNETNKSELKLLFE